MRNVPSRPCNRWGWMRIYLGKTTKFVTVVSNLETGEPLWFGRERKKGDLGRFFRTQLSRPGSDNGSKRLAWTCGSPTRPASKSGRRTARIVYDKFHIMQHANQAGR